MIAASSVETEGNNKPFSPHKCFQMMSSKTLRFVFHRHEFKNRKNKDNKNERKSVQIHYIVWLNKIKCKGSKKLQTLSNRSPERTGAAQGIAQEVTNERDLALGICCCSKTIPYLIPFTFVYIWSDGTQRNKCSNQTHTNRLGWGITTMLTVCLVFKIYRHKGLGTRVCYFQTRRNLIWQEMEQWASQPLP